MFMKRFTDMIDVIKEAQKVFDTEIEALSKMRNALGTEFSEVLNLITECEGKVVITGMGKPGHVAAKLAATFSSLGTPSFYLHPADAMHGDLGMVSANDVVIAISYSGESDEVISILAGIKTIGAKIVAITRNADSTLAQAADLVQILPEFEEACNLGLAPTSSTTVELCYGDALAVVASKVYGFKDTDFGKFHPAGALGKKLLYKISDIMAVGDDVPMVKKGSSLIAAIDELSRKCMSIVSVVDDEENLCGIMTDADFRKVVSEHGDIYNLSIDEVMNQSPRWICSDELAVEALAVMRDTKCNVMPVLDGKKLVGTIHWQQIVRAGIVL